MQITPNGFGRKPYGKTVVGKEVERFEVYSLREEEER